MPPKKAPLKTAQKGQPSIVSRKPTGTTGASKKASNVAQKKSGEKISKESKKPVKKGPTPEDLAAICIQKYARRLLAKRKLQKLRTQAKEYEETIEQLQREAFVAMVKAEQEAAERQLEKEEEERKRKREEVKRRKRMLESAFDGDIDEMKVVLKEVAERDSHDGVPSDEIGQIVRQQHLMAVIECEDANGNTPLSEASGGGSVEAITFLIEKGADPNTIGAWGRTPLYRAAFGGHMAAVECLLQFGADLRIYAHDGNTPAQVASVDMVVDTLNNWDVEVTEALLEKMQSEKERRREEEAKRKTAETNKLQNELSVVQKDFESRQKVLQKAYVELEKRIHEHDKAERSGFERTDVTLSAIKDAEADLEIAKLHEMKARENLEQAKLKLRDSQREGSEDDLPGVKCNIRELDEVLMRDIGNRIKDSGKWPMLIDPTGQASIFLRYRDTNYLCSLNPQNMQPETIRLGLIGALRFGKPLVLDMLEVDMFDTVSDIFNQIIPGLMDEIMSKELLKEEKYMKLVKAEDTTEYQSSKFQHHRVDSFVFVIATKNKYPPAKLLELTYPIRIVLPAT